MMGLPTHRGEHTGNAVLDRIQSNVRDVITFLRSLGWLTQRVHVSHAADSTVATAAYATLLSTVITTTQARSFLFVHFTCSGAQLTSNGAPHFRIVVNDTVIKGAYTQVVLNTAFTLALSVRAPVVAGAQAVRVEWRTNAGSVRINARSISEEHASLYVEEHPA